MSTRMLIELEENGNAAFEDDPQEIARILEELAKDIRENGPRARSLKDINGNTCGRVWLTGVE